MKIGVHLIGDDYANSPPAHILAEKGIVNNVVAIASLAIMEKIVRLES